MQISFHEIKNFFHSRYQTLGNQSVVWKDHGVKWMNQFLEHVQKDKFAAYAVVVAANVIFFHTALKICELLGNFSDRIIPDTHLSEFQIELKNTTIFMIMGGLMIGMNAALMRGLRLPLTPLQVTAASVVSLVAYLAYNLCGVDVNAPIEQDDSQVHLE